MQDQNSTFILEQCSKIQALYEKMCPDLGFNFSHDTDGVTFYQCDLDKKDALLCYPGYQYFCSTPNVECSLRKLDDAMIERFAVWLDVAHSMSLVHGNIKTSNIVFIKGKLNFNPPSLVMLDWESNLLNSENNKKATHRTDLQHFHQLVMRKPDDFYQSEGWIETTSWLDSNIISYRARVLAENFLIKSQVCTTKTKTLIK